MGSFGGAIACLRLPRGHQESAGDARMALVSTIRDHCTRTPCTLCAVTLPIAGGLALQPFDPFRISTVFHLAGVYAVGIGWHGPEEVGKGDWGSLKGCGGR